MVDSKNQIIVAAEAYSHSHEQAVLQPVINQTKKNFQIISNDENVFENVSLSADSGFHSEKNMRMLAEEEIDAYVADPKMRSRDPRFDHSGRFKVRDQKDLKMLVSLAICGAIVYEIQNEPRFAKLHISTAELLVT